MPDTKPKVFWDLPVIADLGDGYYLVAHPNGPGVATADSISTLDAAIIHAKPDADPLYGLIDMEPEDDTFSVPSEIAIKAVSEFVDWAWPKIDPPMTTK